MRNNAMVWGAIALLLLVTLANTFYIVDQRERVVLFQLGELRGSTYTPGLHIKIPFAQSVSRFDGRVLTLDNQTENFLTVEKKNVEVDFYVKWKIEDAAIYYRATRGDEQVAADLLASIVNRAMRDEFGSRTIKQVVSDERDQIMVELEGTVADKVKDLGVRIVDVRIKSINLPQTVSDSVYERMRAERARVASDLRARGAEEAEKIRAEADREAQTTIAVAYSEAETIKGLGDAKAAEIYAAAYGRDPEFYSFYRSLNVYRDSFADRQDVLVLEPKGEFFRHFRGDGANKSK